MSPIQVPIERKGFRTQTVRIATTLSDAKRYRRWSIELFFRDIKTTLMMDVLRCKTPNMVEKEILMLVCAHNAIPLFILHSAMSSVS